MTCELAIIDVGGYGADEFETDLGDALQLTLTIDGQQAGYVNFNHRGDFLRLRWIEVAPAFRRQGVATRMMGHLADTYPGLPVITGGFTHEGGMFVAATGIDVFEERDEED